MSIFGKVGEHGALTLPVEVIDNRFFVMVERSVSTGDRYSVG